MSRRLAFFVALLAALASMDSPRSIAPTPAPERARPAGPGRACPEGRGPAMARVPAPGGASFCIDKTEVTRAQYLEFYRSEPFDRARVPGVCNPRYWASFGLQGGGETGDPCNDPEIRRPSTRESGEVPVECASWCNAKIYCEWAGKRLCGPLEAGGDGALDEWSLACNEGARGADDAGCNDATMTRGDPPRAAGDRCRGASPPLAEVVDLRGNVLEWEGRCERIDGATYCGLRGFDSSATRPSCGAPGEPPLRGGVTLGAPGYGIRCCAD